MTYICILQNCNGRMVGFNGGSSRYLPLSRFTCLQVKLTWDHEQQVHGITNSRFLDPHFADNYANSKRLKAAETRR